jgi:hypothetical protein
MGHLMNLNKMKVWDMIAPIKTFFKFLIPYNSSQISDIGMKTTSQQLYAPIANQQR